MSTTPFDPDLILFNGKVFTADPAWHYAQTVTLSGSRDPGGWNK